MFSHMVIIVQNIATMYYTSRIVWKYNYCEWFYVNDIFIETLWKLIHAATNEIIYTKQNFLAICIKTSKSWHVRNFYVGKCRKDYIHDSVYQTRVPGANRTDYTHTNRLVQYLVVLQGHPQLFTFNLVQQIFKFDLKTSK